MGQKDRQTDGRTDGRTDGLWVGVRVERKPADSSISCKLNVTEADSGPISPVASVVKFGRRFSTLFFVRFQTIRHRWT